MSIDTINNKDSQYYPTTTRNIKDRLFRFIFQNKSEVISMVLTTFDQAAYERDIREDGYEDGFQDGFQDGLEKSLPPVIAICQKAAFTKEATLEYLIQNFSLKEQLLQKYIEQYWK